MARLYSVGTDLINIGSSSSLDPTSKTISIWFNSSHLNSTSSFTAVCSRNNAGTHGYDIYTNAAAANKISWFWVNSSANGTLTVSQNVWVHIALVLDNAGGTAKGYINGTQDVSGTYAYTLVSATSYIGADPNNLNFAGLGSGSLADFAIWSAALTVAEIGALANGARPYTIRPLSIVAYLPLDGLASPEPDLSGNKFNGTLTGTALSFGPPLMQFTPRIPIIETGVIAAGPSFQPAWAMRNRIVVEGIGI